MCVAARTQPWLLGVAGRSLPERWQPVWRRGSGRARDAAERPVSPRRAWRPASSPQAFRSRLGGRFRRGLGGGRSGRLGCRLRGGLGCGRFRSRLRRSLGCRLGRRFRGGLRSRLAAGLAAGLAAAVFAAGFSPRVSPQAWRRPWLPVCCRLGRCGFRRGLGSRFRRRLGRCLRRRLDADAGEFLDLPGQRIDLAVQLLHLVAARHAGTRDGAVQALVESFLELAPLAERTVPNLVDLALRRAGGSLRRTDLRVHIGLRFFSAFSPSFTKVSNSLLPSLLTFE